MTILGAIANRDEAVIWADTLLTNARTRAGTGEVCKLAVNGLAGAIGAGRGWGRLASEADAALLAALTLDEAVPLVSNALRRGAARHAPTSGRVNRFSFMGCGYVIAGWSTEAGRMVVWDLDARANFEPAIATQVLAPMVDLASLAVPTPPDVGAIASRQAELARLGGYGVGRLTVAIIMRDGIDILPPQEIAPLPCPAAGDGATPAPGVAPSGQAKQPHPLHLVA